MYLSIGMGTTSYLPLAQSYLYKKSYKKRSSRRTNTAMFVLFVLASPTARGLGVAEAYSRKPERAVEAGGGAVEAGGGRRWPTRALVPGKLSEAETGPAERIQQSSPRTCPCENPSFLCHRPSVGECWN